MGLVMKSQYILGIITGASLMLALMVFSGAKNDDSNFEITYVRNTPQWLFDTSNGDLYIWKNESDHWKQVLEIK